MNPTIYTIIAYFSWVVLGLTWLPGYFTAKRTVARPNPIRRWVALALIVLGYALLVSHPGPCGVNTREFGACIPLGILTPQIAILGILGLALDLIGVAFAIWARITLGNNWSNAITLKESHELVQSGPYALVRHPIYTGLLLGMLGTALTVGSVASYLGIVCFLVAILIRIHDEDALMAKEFGEAHAAYRARTRALIPFIW